MVKHKIPLKKGGKGAVILIIEKKQPPVSPFFKGEYLDHYQVRHINKIDRYWNLCLVAWTLTYWIKQNAYLTKILETKPTTFNEIKQAVNSILEFASTNTLSKNETLADGYFKIKSKRLKKKCAA